MESVFGEISSDEKVCTSEGNARDSSESLSSLTSENLQRFVHGPFESGRMISFFSAAVQKESLLYCYKVARLGYCIQ